MFDCLHDGNNTFFLMPFKKTCCLDFEHTNKEDRKLIKEDRKEREMDRKEREEDRKQRLMDIEQMKRTEGYGHKDKPRNKH